MGFIALKKYLPWFLFLGVLSIYITTMAPVVYLGDSGEFTAAAFSLGIPHNSGYPLYAILGKLFCMIPVGNVGFRMNLMSAVFSSLTVVLVFDAVFRFTASRLCAFAAAAYLAFTPLFWSQTVSAEVYPLHLFFVALMIRLLWQWEKSRAFRHLLLFVFVTGLSFTNHMQTLMLAPPVLYFIISGDRKAIFTGSHFFTITVFFILPLFLYLYLPIRTEAGAAIHWGDPDNLERFLAHVTATAHRSAYVFSGGLSQYLHRTLGALRVTAIQYGVLLLLCFWGWVRLSSLRWKLFLAGLMFFDLVYTVFLNVISLEVTPFGLPSVIVLAILLGAGLDQFLAWIRQQRKIGRYFRKCVSAGLCAIPIMALISNFGFCDQSRNYTAYEHAVNIFRTADPGSTLFLDGDNNVFPVAYGRIVEGMGQGISLHDRHNVIFRWRLATYPLIFEGSWDELESTVLHQIIRSKSDKGVYFATINPFAISVPKGFRTVPCGILRKAITEIEKPSASTEIWKYYGDRSFHDHFTRDYMNREVASHYFFRQGEAFWLSRRTVKALRFLKLASQIGYNDTSIHSDLGVFYTDQGLFEEARKSLEKSLLYHDNKGGVYNNWGYYYHKKGEYQNAVSAFEKAVLLSPDHSDFYNNLGFARYRAGDKKEALAAFEKSLTIREEQPEIDQFIEEKMLR